MFKILLIFCLCLSSLVEGQTLSNTKIIIQPDLPTDSSLNRFTSFEDIVAYIVTIDPSVRPNITIIIPANVTVHINDTVSLIYGENCTMVIQGEDRKTSALVLDLEALISSSLWNLTFTNLLLVSSSSLHKSQIFGLKGSLNFMDMEISALSDFNTTYCFISSVQSNLQIQRINASFSQNAGFIQSGAASNTAIQDSVFYTRSPQEFLNFRNDYTYELNQSVSLTNVSFIMTGNSPTSSKAAFTNFEKIGNLHLQDISLSITENVDLYRFIKASNLKSITLTNLDIETFNNSLTFDSFIEVHNTATEITDPATVISNLKLKGHSGSFARGGALAIFFTLNYIIPTSVTLSNISLDSLNLYNTALLYSTDTGGDFLIDSITVNNCTINSTLVFLNTMLPREKCSFIKEDQTGMRYINGLTITKSQIDKDSNSYDLISIDSGCSTEFLRKVFLNSFRLTNWEIHENTVFPSSDEFTSTINFVKMSGFNTLVKNLSLKSNNFIQSNFFELCGVQPIIHLSNVTFEGNIMSLTTFILKNIDSAAFLNYLSFSSDASQIIPNFRYMLIENCAFKNITLERSSLIKGDTMPLISINNSFEGFTLNRSSVFNLQYLISQKPPVQSAQVNDLFPDSKLIPEQFDNITQGRPTIYCNCTTFNNFQMEESFLMSADYFDIYRKFDRFYSRIILTNNVFTNFNDTSKNSHHLFNFWYGGTITISSNSFEKVITSGVIFAIKQTQTDTCEISFSENYGTFIFSNNTIIGYNIPRSETEDPDDIAKDTQTSILRYAVDGIKQFFFEDNHMANCNVFDRGFVDVLLEISPASNIIRIKGNSFDSNRLIAGNCLQGNFFNILSKGGYDDNNTEFSVTQTSFTNNFIDGNDMLTGSLLSLTPALLQIRASSLNVRVENLNLTGNTFNAYGYLITTIAATMGVEGVCLSENILQESTGFVSSDNSAIGMQGMFFFSTPYIYINDVNISFNRIEKGSYFFIDNFWSAKSDNETNIGGSIHFTVTNCDIDSNGVWTGGIIMYSEVMFSLNLRLLNNTIKASRLTMNWFLSISNPRQLNLLISDCEFEILSPLVLDSTNHHRYSNLFLFKNSATKSKMPVENSILIVNSTFRSINYMPSSNILILSVINEAADTFLVRFVNCQFLPSIQADTHYLPRHSNDFQFSVISSDLVIENCTFADLKIAQESIFSITGSSNLKISNSTFQNISQSLLNYGGGIAFIQDSELNMKETIISNVTIEQSIIIMEHHTGALSSFIKGCHFVDNIGYKRASLIENIETSDKYTGSSVRIESSVFENNLFKEDSTSTINNKGGALEVLYSVFRNNSVASGKGAALYNTDSKVLSSVVLFDTTFENNQAQIGGAVFTNNQIEITKCMFLNNSASIAAGAIVFEASSYPADLLMLLSTSKFQDNYSPRVNNALGYPDHLKWELISDEHPINKSLQGTYAANHTEVIGNFTPGDTLGFHLKVTLYDTFNNTIPSQVYEFENKSASLSLVRRNNKKLMEGEEEDLKSCTVYSTITTDWNSESLLFNSSDLRLISPFNSAVFIKVATTIENTPMHLVLNAKANSHCRPGEIYDSELMLCQPCQSGWYSRNEQDIGCHPCPDNAKCYEGRDKVAIDSGYWANMSENIIVPIDCINNPKACKGGLESACSAGYIGPSCEDCDYFGESTGISYTKAGYYQCDECANLKSEIVFASLIFVGIFIMGGIFVAVNIFSNERYVNNLEQGISVKNPTGAYIRLLATYMQILGILKTFNIQMPGTLSTILAAGNPTQTIRYSSECLLIEFIKKYDMHQISFPYLSSIFTLAVFLSKFALYAFIWLALRLILKDRMKVRYLTVAFISIYYLEQPSLVANIYSIVSCKDTDGSNYLAKYANYSCSTQEHKLFLYYFALPALIMLVLIIPMVIFMHMYRKRENISSCKRTVYKFGTLIMEYNPKYFYWSFVLMGLKFVLITLSNILPGTCETEQKIKAFGLMFIFAVYLIMIRKMRPYSQTNVYTLDCYLTYLNIAIIYLAYGALNLDSNGSFAGVYWVSFICLIGLNLLFIIYVALLIYKANVEVAYSVISRVSAYVRRNNATKDEKATGISSALLDDNNSFALSLSPRDHGSSLSPPTERCSVC